MNLLHDILKIILDASVLVFDYISVAIILVTGVCGAISYIKKNELTRLRLAKGFTMALEFKLGSEILRTIIVGEISELLIIAAIIGLHTALTFLMHWEIKDEESHFRRGTSTGRRRSNKDDI